MSTGIEWERQERLYSVRRSICNAAAVPQVDEHGVRVDVVFAGSENFNFAAVSLVFGGGPGLRLAVASFQLASLGAAGRPPLVGSVFLEG